VKRHLFKILLAFVRALVVAKRLIVWFGQTVARFFAWILRPAIPLIIAPLYQVFRRYWRRYLELSPDAWARRRFIATSRPAVTAYTIAAIFFLTWSSVNASDQPGVVSGSHSVLLTYIVTGGESDWVPSEDDEFSQGIVAEQVPTIMYRDGGAVAFVYPFSGAVGRAPATPDEPPTPEQQPQKATSPIQKYAVQRGDTLAKIARKFGIKVETLLWANNLKATSVLRQGDSITILAADGVIYTVKSGGTVADVAKKFNVATKTVASANNLTIGATLKKGQQLIVPGVRPIEQPKPPVSVARVEAPTPQQQETEQQQTAAPDAAPPDDQLAPEPEPTPPALEVIKRPTLQAGEKMLWPTKRRAITQYYSARHQGLDIDGDYTDPIYATDDGTVTFSGWNNTGYGNMVLIDHGNGIVSRYGHSSKVYVRVGQQVTRGDIIAMVGTTGRSTGTHLHFEVMVNGRRANPFKYVR